MINFVKEYYAELGRLMSGVEVSGGRQKSLDLYAGVRAAAELVGAVGLGAQALQTGRINAYVYWFLFGLVVLWAFATGVLAF